MAYLLQFPAGTAYVNTGRLILGAGYSVTFDIQRDSDVDIYLSSDSGDELRYIVGTGWQIRISNIYYTYNDPELTPPIGTRFTVTFSRSGSTSTRGVALNGGTVYTRTTATDNLWVNNLGQGVGGVYQAFKLYKVTVTNPANTTFNRVFDADASGGAGSSLINTLTGSNNGTLTGAGWSIPACWVFYSSGAYTLTADGATFSYSGGIASTIYSRILSADGGLFGYSGGAASTWLNRSIAADGATFGYFGGSSALLYGRMLQAAGGYFSYSGGVATFVYNPITGYVLNADGGIFSYAGGEAALSFNQNYPTANPNDYTVSAYLSNDSTYTARLSESSTINAIISSETTYAARLN